MSLAPLSAILFRPSRRTVHFIAATPCAPPKNAFLKRPTSFVPPQVHCWRKMHAPRTLRVHRTHRRGNAFFTSPLLDISGIFRGAGMRWPKGLAYNNGGLHSTSSSS